MRLAVQLHTLRSLEEPLIDTVRRLGDTAYEAVQFAGLGESNPADLAAVLDEEGLDVAGGHIYADMLEDEYEQTRDAYETLGTDDLVISSYSREAFKTVDGARRAGEYMSDLAERIASDGFDLHYHNHDYEFVTRDGERLFDVWAAAADGVGVEIDTGLANHGDDDPVTLIERYGDRIDLLHLTDNIPGAQETIHMDLGTGEVDVEACVEAAHDADVEWLIYENGATKQPIESVQNAADFLEPLL